LVRNIFIRTNKKKRKKIFVYLSTFLLSYNPLSNLIVMTILIKYIIKCFLKNQKLLYLVSLSIHKSIWFVKCLLRLKKNRKQIYMSIFKFTTITDSSSFYLTIITELQV